MLRHVTQAGGQQESGSMPNMADWGMEMVRLRVQSSVQIHPSQLPASANQDTAPILADATPKTLIEFLILNLQRGIKLNACEAGVLSPLNILMCYEGKY